MGSPGLDEQGILRILEAEIQAGKPVSASGLRRAIARAMVENNRRLLLDLGPPEGPPEGPPRVQEALGELRRLQEGLDLGSAGIPEVRAAIRRIRRTLETSTEPE